MCLVAFQKTFRKIFSGVWKRRRKTQIRKHKPQPRKKKIINDENVSSPTTARSTARSRSRLLREITIDGEIAIFARSRSTKRSREDRDLAFAISDWSWSRRSRTGSSPLARARALSLSLIFWKCFEGKIEV